MAANLSDLATGFRPEISCPGIGGISYNVCLCGLCAGVLWFCLLCFPAGKPVYWIKEWYKSVHVLAVFAKMKHVMKHVDNCLNHPCAALVHILIMSQTNALICHVLCAVQYGQTVNILSNTCHYDVTFTFTLYCAYHNFLFPQNVQAGPGAIPSRAIHWLRGGGCVLTPEMNRPGREAHNSPLSNTKNKNTWKYTSAPCSTVPTDTLQLSYSQYAFLWLRSWGTKYHVH
jgi:hypothetical protein